MTHKGRFKRMVRARMGKTGESYAAARASLVHTETVTQPPPGGRGMNSFHQFTEGAKKVLTLAQEEAERSHHSYIGTEHLLIGLFREADGLAATVMGNLGVDLAAVRQALKSVVGRNERIIIRKVIPTSRMKKVIELSFKEAERLGHRQVGTEHLLLGMLIEGEGIGARVLNDLGVTVDTARAETERLLKEPSLAEDETPVAPTTPAVETGVPLGHETVLVIGFARMLAAAEKAPSVTLDHLQRVVANPVVGALLGQARRVAEVQAAKEAAISSQDYEEAARIREQEKELKAAYEKAVAAWRRGLSQRPRRRRPES